MKRVRELDELVARFLQGERDLIDDIMGLLYGAVYRMFRGRGISADDVPDVAEQFFEELFEKRIRRYTPKPDHSFWGWLTVVIRHYAMDYHRNRARNPETAIGDSVESLTAMEEPSSEGEFPPSERLVLLAEIFSIAFDRLAPHEQDLLRMREVAEMEYEEIALVLFPGLVSEEVPVLVNRLRTQLHRAKEKIRAEMESNPRVPRDLFDKGKKGALVHGNGE